MSRKVTIEDMQEAAKKHGGKCLSENYKTEHTKLLWECSEGHQWETSWATIKAGRWCPVCLRKKPAKKIPIQNEEMRGLAKTRGGRCVSITYKDSRSKLLWECLMGHRWSATLTTIRKGCWCPKCSGTNKLTIEEMEKIAEQRGGKCLSNTYKNAHTKLLWECSEGHQWEAIPNNVKRGTWCRKCSKRK